ncbi:type II secretion system F family protein [Nocardia sp. NPDC052566]|uniref:type II secretion system F family protein n=1 Tax=Nocardia sp. NPDC052566 TaxID=3364330 RepID=UPI0037C7DC5F
MSAALGCLALALLAVPMPAARRRFARVFGASSVDRKPARGTVVRVGAGVVVAATVLLGIGPLLAAVLVAGTLGTRMRRASRERRRGAECGYLLDALEAVIGELRVGAHPSIAAEVAATESTGAAAHAFAVSAARSRLGGSGADGLRDPNSVISTELTRIADAWHVAEHHGLALAELLTAARADLLGRTRFRTRTTAALAGARATATVLATLPLLGIALGQLMGAAPLSVLLTTPAGTVLLPLGATLACAGLLWTDAITHRVLT